MNLRRLAGPFGRLRRARRRPLRRRSVLRHPGIRARVLLSLVVAVVAMAPVVLQSLLYIERLGGAVERLDAQGERVHRMLTDLDEEVRTGSPEGLRRALAEIDARLLGMTAARAEAGTVLQEARRNVLTVLLLSSAALALLVWLLPRRVVAPLRRILNVLRRASGGDYSTQARLESPDEVGAMAREVNRLLAHFGEAMAGREWLIRSTRRDLHLFGRGVPEALCLLDRERRILWNNPAFDRLVAADEELAGQSLADWAGGPELEKRLERAFGGGIEEGEVELVLAEGARVPRRLYAAAGHDPEGRVDRVAVVLS